MEKRTNKTKLPLSSGDNNLYLQNITKKLISIIKNIAQRIESADEEELESLKTCHEIAFGQKSSLAGALIILSDLLIRLSADAENSKNQIAVYNKYA